MAVNAGDLEHAVIIVVVVIPSRETGLVERSIISAVGKKEENLANGSLAFAFDGATDVSLI